VFARTEVLGFEQLIYELTPAAIELGLAAALPAVFELGCSIAEFGRGERTQTSDAQLNVPEYGLRCAVRGIERWTSGSA